MSTIKLNYVYDNYKEIKDGKKPYKTNDDTVLCTTKTVKK